MDDKMTTDSDHVTGVSNMVGGVDDTTMVTDKQLYELVKPLTGNISSIVKAIKIVREKYPVRLAVAKDYVYSVKDDGSFPVQLEVERLQSENEALRARLAQVEAERDAAVKALEFPAGVWRTWLRDLKLSESTAEIPFVNWLDINYDTANVAYVFESAYTALTPTGEG